MRSPHAVQFTLRFIYYASSLLKSTFDPIHPARHGTINKNRAAQPFKEGKTMQNKKITFWMVMLALLKTIGRAALWAAVVAFAIIRAICGLSKKY